MSETLQLGQHPDADQLSAFAEQALPAHERERTLAHLAGCADCRKIVALALAPLEEVTVAVPVVASGGVPVVVPAGARGSSPGIGRGGGGWLAGWPSGWSSGWRLAWIAAPALAAMIVATIYLREAGRPRQAVRPAQTAELRPPAPSGAKQETSAAVKAPGTPAGAAKARRGVPGGGESSGSDLPVNGGRFGIRREAPVGNQTAEVSAGGVAGVADASVAGGVASGVAAGGVAAGGVAGGVAGGGYGAGGGMGAGPSGGRRAADGAAPVNRFAPAAPLAGQVEGVSAKASAAAPVVAGAVSAEKAGVGAAAGGEAIPAAGQPLAVTATSSLPSYGLRKNGLGSGLGSGIGSGQGAGLGSGSGLAPLPSGLPIVSIAANLDRRLALDAQHGLFLSEDEGRHWKAVSAPWPGHALAVAMVPVDVHQAILSAAAPARFAGGAVGAASPSVRGFAGSSARPAGQLTALGSLGGTVTDATGAVIPGAVVAVKEVRSGVSTTGKTDATGRYLFANLAPGSYQVEAGAPGFERRSVAQEVGSAQHAVANLTLAVGQTAETVSVAAADAQLETEPKTPSSAARSTKSDAASPAVKQSPPIFAIITDNGERWTSADGLSWQREAGGPVPSKP